MKKTGYDMLYLSSCAVNGIKPDFDRINDIDLSKLFQICQFHSLTAIVCMALESAGISDKNFIEAKSKAIRKNILLDAERTKICEFMENNGIWHITLKGVILKELYPKTGMRQMSDNDILYDGSYQQQLLKYMKKSGYTVKSVGKTNHDIYMKPPIYNFEMHTSLFRKNNNESFYGYYANVINRLVKDIEKKYEYHFTDEDFYIYITAHEYKHYINGGTGLRSLLDRFVYLNNKNNLLDWDYIYGQLEILGISEFEKNSRELSMKIFTDFNYGLLSDEEKKMLEFYLFSGTYGTFQEFIKKRFKKFSAETGSTSKFRYIRSRIFPPMNFYKMHYPFFYQHKLLIPVCWISRLIRGIVFRKKSIKNELYFLYRSDD